MYLGFFTFIKLQPFQTTLVGSGHYVFQLATVLKRLTWPVWTSQQSALLETGPFGSHCASVLCLGCLSWSWTYIVCLPDCLAMRLVLQSTAVGNRWPTMFCRICNILIYMQEPHILLTKYHGHVDNLRGNT